MTEIFDRSVSVFKERGFSCVEADANNFQLQKGAHYLIYTATGKGFVNVGVYDFSRGEILEGSNYGTGIGSEDEFTVLGNCIIECEEDKSFRVDGSENATLHLGILKLSN